MRLKHNEQTLTIELNERLSFRHEESIEEMVSVAIDPDIIIHSYEDYIQIRGIIILVGEYRPKFSYQQPTTGEEVMSNRDQLIEKVIFSENGLANFTHRFPVEISVTKERVQAIEEVYVTVDSFDYEIPSADTLQITAALHIHGIQPESAGQKSKETRELVAQDKEKESSTHEHFTSYTRPMQEDTPIEPEDTTEALSRKEEATTEVEVNEEEKERETKTHEKEEAQRLRLIKSSEVTNQGEPLAAKEKIERDREEATQEVETEEVSIEEEQIVEAQTEVEMEQTDEKEEVEEELEAKEALEQDEMQIELSESEEEEEEIKGVSFLTELFTSETESYTQVTIYIAQPNDSVESIAKRYEIPVLQLLKDNNLSGEQLEEGQLIMIRERILTE